MIRHKFGAGEGIECINDGISLVLVKEKRKRSGHKFGSSEGFDKKSQP